MGQAVGLAASSPQSPPPYFPIRGSMLLRSRADPSLYTAAARWDSFEDWQAFMGSDPADQEAFAAMRSASEPGRPIDKTHRKAYSLGGSAPRRGWWFRGLDSIAMFDPRPTEE